MAKKAKQKSAGVIFEEGAVRLERLENGRFCCLHPEISGAEFGAEQEAAAREYYWSIVRRERVYPTVNPELFNARAVRPLCKDDVPLSTFHECSLVNLSKLLEWIDEADATEPEKTAVKQRLLKFQARARLKEISK